MLAFLLGFWLDVFAAPQKVTVPILVKDAGTGKPVPGAFVKVSPSGIWAVSDSKGEASLAGVPVGKSTLTVEILGYVKHSSEITVTASIPRQVISLVEESLSINEVVVVAQSGAAGESTSSTIGRQALDHLQATSLKDVLQLLPGHVITSNPSLTTSGYFVNRTLDKYDSNNALGTAIVVDGVPVSTNADLNTRGGTYSNAGTGVDLRSIGTDDVEAVEVIRGIASAEYGDLSSGTMLIKSKVGITDLNVKAKIYPGITQFYVGKGVGLGKMGTLNVNVDYADGKSDPRYTTDTYHRTLASLIHSVTLDGKYTFTTKASFTGVKDWSGADPDEVLKDVWSWTKDRGVTLSHSGKFNLDHALVRNLKYDISASYRKTTSYTRSYVSGNRPLTNATKDGTYEATMLPVSYYGCGGTDGRPLNLFAKLSDSFFWNSFDQHLTQRFLLGAEFRSDGNLGEGYTNDNPMLPLQASYARQRSFKDIPFLNQLSAYAEDNVSIKFSGKYPVINLQAGLRWTMVQPGMKEQISAISPRLNSSMDVCKWLTLRFGYGISSKTPPLLYMYPDKSYFDYLNINSSNGKGDYLGVYTTKVLDRTPESLTTMSTKKMELGFDVHTTWGQKFSVIAYREIVDDGFGSDNSYWRSMSFSRWTSSDVTDTGSGLAYDPANPSSTTVLLDNTTKPSNTDVHKNYGVELDCNLGKIARTGTSFYLTGSYTMSEYYTSNMVYSTPMGFSGTYSDIYVVYPSGANSSQRRRGTAVLRVVQSIPRLNFVVSGTIQSIFYDYSLSGRYAGAPLGYITPDTELTENGQVSGVKYTPFTSEEKASPEGVTFGGKYLLSDNILARTAYSENPEIWPPLWDFNLRVTKDITKDFGVSFYVNNLFFSQPWQKSSISSSLTEKNSDLFSFGVEIYLNL